MTTDLKELNFNGIDGTNLGGFEPFPNGWYTAVLESIEDTATKTGTGKYFKCQFMIINGDFANRKVFMNINYKNSNSQAEKIGLSQLFKLCSVLDYANPSEVGELSNLLNRPIDIKTKIKIDPKYGDSNVILDFKKMDTKIEYRVPPKNVPGTNLADDDNIPF